MDAASRVPTGSTLCEMRYKPTMKTPPTPLQSLFRAVLVIGIALVLWPLWKWPFVFLGELSYLLFPLFLLILLVAFFARFVRQLDGVRGPFPREDADKPAP